MAFMELQITQKGFLATADCAKCGATLYAHEWASWDCNGDRDALENGTYVCQECGGRADPDTYSEGKGYYAARYSAPGYMDCTEWAYGKNKRELIREVRDMYGAD